jgi:hypothetical protein
VSLVRIGAVLGMGEVESHQILMNVSLGRCSTNSK